MESNPYAAPATALDDVPAATAADLESRKATRGVRLGAVMLNGVTNVVWLAPVIGGAVMSDGIKQGVRSSAPMFGLIGLGMVMMVALIVINGVLLHRHGQTLGKRWLNIAMVRTDGSRMGLTRFVFIRSLPVGLLGGIPLVGWLVTLGDPLMIFGEQRRCLHDLIADTIVVNV